MSYLLDTDWLIDYLSDRASAILFVKQLLPSELSISVITLAETYEGIYTGRNPATAEADLLKFLRNTNVLNITPEVARDWGRVQGNLRSAGRKMPPADLFIAATALTYDLTLVSRNRRHFDRVPGLKLISHPSELTDDL